VKHGRGSVKHGRGSVKHGRGCGDAVAALISLLRVPIDDAAGSEGAVDRSGAIRVIIIGRRKDPPVEGPTVSFVSLGCPKNLVDSEKMLGLLAEAGCGIVAPGAGEADVMIVNTCGFLGASRDEALGVLREAAAQKRAGALRRIVAAGCLVQRDGHGLLEAIPEIDALVGVNHRRDIVRAVTGESNEMRDGAAGADGRTVFLGEYHAASWAGANRSDRARLRLTPAHYAYLRMSEGCNQKCTFCTIPSIRGPMHCKTVPDILAEARELIADGAVELNLIGQDTTSYGADIGYQPGLAGLLRELNSLGGVRWIRLMYAYPSDFTDEMIDAIGQCGRVAKYIDIPLQHINDRVLRTMYRRVTRKQTEALLAKLRARIDGVAIRTTLIAGFPGESDGEFDELCDFVRDFGFDAMGVFPYSDESGTPAHRMNGHLPPEVIASRVDRLMRIQQEVAFAKAEAMKGKTLTVLIDDFGRDGVYPSRHQGQAPDVDSVVQVRGGEYDPGDFAEARCIGREGYDLLAEPIAAGLPILG
jgi:ribosomal protein S12 methylthiotransferase